VFSSTASDEVYASTVQYTARETIRIETLQMEQVRPATLIDAAKAFWGNFLPAWIFPVFFLFGGLASETLGHPLLFFWLVALPLFFWSFLRWARLGLERKVRYWHAVFWGMVFPFIIGVTTAFSRLIAIRVLCGTG